MEHIELECFICSEVLKEPKTLPCGHNYCADCLEKIFTKFKKCSVCSATIDSIENIKVNTFVVFAIETMKASKKKEVPLKNMVEMEQAIESIPKSFCGEPMYKYKILWDQKGLPFMIECGEETYALGELGIYFSADTIDLMGNLAHKEEPKSLKEKFQYKQVHTQLGTAFHIDSNKSLLENYKIITTEKIRHFLYDKREIKPKRDYMFLVNVLFDWENNCLKDFLSFDGKKIEMESSLLFECFSYALIACQVSAVAICEKQKPSDLAIAYMKIASKGSIDLLTDKIRDFYHLQKLHIHNATKIEVERIVAYAILIYQAKSNCYFSFRKQDYPFEPINDTMGTKGMAPTISSTKELRDYWMKMRDFISKTLLKKSFKK